MKPISPTQSKMLRALETLGPRGVLNVVGFKQERTIEALRRRGLVERGPRDLGWRLSRWGRMGIPKL